MSKVENREEIVNQARAATASKLIDMATELHIQAEELDSTLLKAGSVAIVAVIQALLRTENDHELMLVLASIVRQQADAIVTREFGQDMLLEELNPKLRSVA
jgi:hypothetical protein